VDGVTYTNVTFGAVTPSSVSIWHSTGIALVPLAACRTLVARLFCDDDGLHLKSERAQAYREHACTICQR
jgi:hypothetical protein